MHLFHGYQCSYCPDYRPPKVIDLKAPYQIPSESNSFSPKVEDENTYIITSQCQTCFNFIYSLARWSGETPGNRRTLIKNFRDGIGSNLADARELEALFVVEGSLPPSGAPKPPQWLPPTIQQIYTDELIPAIRTPPLVATVCRKIFEHLDLPELEDIPRKDRSPIKVSEALVKAQLVPKVFGDWARDVLKGWGDEGPHNPEPVPREAADLLLEFTNYILDFLYTKPMEIKHLREKLEEHHPEKHPPGSGKTTQVTS